jgi:hypothetical protein
MLPAPMGPRSSQNSSQPSRSYGIVSPPAIGHLNPMVALALELMRRRHRVVMFSVADGARKLEGRAGCADAEAGRGAWWQQQIWLRGRRKLRD